MNTMNARPFSPVRRRMSRLRHPLTRTTIALTAGFTLGLAGCTTTPETTTTTSGPSASSSTAVQSGRTSPEDAASTARDLTPGSTAISVESENAGQHWEVKTAMIDGVEYVTLVDVDNGSVVRGPDKTNEDAEDSAETRALLGGAKLDHREAAKLIRQQVSDGTLIELNLDDFSGRAVWEGDVLDASGVKHEVKIDALSGSVVANNTDTPDD